MHATACHPFFPQKVQEAEWARKLRALRPPSPRQHESVSRLERVGIGWVPRMICAAPLGRAEGRERKKKNSRPTGDEDIPPSPPPRSSGAYYTTMTRAREGEEKRKKDSGFGGADPTPGKSPRVAAAYRWGHSFEIDCSGL